MRDFIATKVKKDMGTQRVTNLRSNPFFILRLTTRDNSRTIVEAAEERSLFVDEEVCQKARADLTNPRTRLSAEMGWMPGVAPSTVEKIVQSLEDDPIAAHDQKGLPALARANIMAAACEVSFEYESADAVSLVISKLCGVVENVDAEDVIRFINEDRAVSGFPEVPSIEVVQDKLIARNKVYRSIIKALLDRMDSTKLIETVTKTVDATTDRGNQHGPALLYDLVDLYEVGTQEFLEKERENCSTLIMRLREAGPEGDLDIFDTLERTIRNWNTVASPIQIAAKSRGTTHGQSREIAYELRSLGIDLVNEHDNLILGQRMTKLLRETFEHVPGVSEKLEDDAKALANLRQQAEQRKRDNEEWSRAITFRAEVGLMFKEELSISPSGIQWKGNHYPLETITRVRWGGIRKSVNGIPTGTDYTIAFGDVRSEQQISLRKEATYVGFTQALWRGVCVRLMFEMLQSLSEGRSFTFGDIRVEDDTVTLPRHKFFGNEPVRLTWHDVKIWTSDGNVVIGQSEDKNVYGKASYINVANAHILEHIIRGGFKKGIRKLSDFLKD